MRTNLYSIDPATISFGPLNERTFRMSHNFGLTVANNKVRIYCNILDDTGCIILSIQRT